CSFRRSEEPSTPSTRDPESVWRRCRWNRSAAQRRSRIRLEINNSLPSPRGQLFPFSVYRELKLARVENGADGRNRVTQRNRGSETLGTAFPPFPRGGFTLCNCR